MTTITTQKIFDSKSRDSVTVGLLDSCVDWASANQQQGNDERTVQTPMLIFNEEMQGATTTFRRMVAWEVQSFLEHIDGATTALFLHEIVESDAPTKLAFDVELKFDDDDVDALFGTTDPSELVAHCTTLVDRLIERCLAALAQMVGRELDEAAVVRLDCTRDDKFSQHLTFDGSDGQNNSIVFRSDADCAAFVETVLTDAVLADDRARYEKIVDKGIYDDRHPLRTYYSAKRKAPQQRMRALGDGPCDGLLMARSLRSCFVVHGATGLFFHQLPASGVAVTSLFARDDPAIVEPMIRMDSVATNRVRSARVRSRTRSALRAGDAHGAAFAAVESALLTNETLAAFEPTRLICLSDSIIVKCASVDCSAHQSKRHRADNQCVFLKVDLMEQMYVQLCHSTDCQQRRRAKPPAAQPLPADVAAAVRNYLNSAEWAGGVNVGADFVTAIGRQK